MRKLFFIIGGIIIMGGLTGCGDKNKTEIEQSFEKVLVMYPTPNLEDFFDMEGYRDSEFDENDKGVWVLNSDMSKSKTKDGDLYTEGMHLELDRNTRTAKGYYYISITPNTFGESSNKKEYPVIYSNKKFEVLNESTDNTIKEKIKNFKFFVQYGNFNNLSDYQSIKNTYNPEVPLYELEYQLTNENQNVQTLREIYNIPITNDPILLLEGRGDLEGDSVGYKQVKFIFDKNLSIYFTDFIDFQPAAYGGLQ